MFYYIFAMLLGLACPSSKHYASGTDDKSIIVTKTDDHNDPGGDTGQVPPRPPRP